MLVEPLVYKGAERTFTITSGFLTDFASVPRILRSLVPTHTRAAVLHDWLYATAKTTRKDADGLFLRAMREAGINKVKRFAMYAAVRVFGFAAWNRHRRGH